MQIMVNLKKCSKNYKNKLLFVPNFRNYFSNNKHFNRTLTNISNSDNFNFLKIL